MATIYLAIDGQSKGPYTLAQVRDFYSKGESRTKAVSVGFGW